MWFPIRPRNTRSRLNLEPLEQRCLLAGGLLSGPLTQVVDATAAAVGVTSAPGTDAAMLTSPGEFPLSIAQNADGGGHLPPGQSGSSLRTHPDTPGAQHGGGHNKPASDGALVDSPANATEDVAKAHGKGKGQDSADGGKSAPHRGGRDKNQSTEEGDGDTATHPVDHTTGPTAKGGKDSAPTTVEPPPSAVRQPPEEEGETEVAEQAQRLPAANRVGEEVRVKAVVVVEAAGEAHRLTDGFVYWEEHAEAARHALLAVPAAAAPPPEAQLFLKRDAASPDGHLLPESPAPIPPLVAPRAAVVQQSVTVRALEVTEEVAAVDGPAPRVPGLAEDAVVDVAALEQAFAEFLTALTEPERTLAGWLAQLGPAPWILMSLALAGTAFGTLRQQQRRQRLVTADDAVRPDWGVG
jgi:hypothetical protein